MCLSGPASEEYFCGKIDDDGDRTDYEMARRYLAQRFDVLQIGFEIARCRSAAERLVRGSAQRIQAIANALLEHGALSGEQIGNLITSTRPYLISRRPNARFGSDSGWRGRFQFETFEANRSVRRPGDRKPRTRRRAAAPRSSGQPAIGLEPVAGESRGAAIVDQP